MLFTQIKLGYPSLWVKSIDSYTTIDTIVNFNFRSFFMIDSTKGFCEYKNGEWKPILLDMPSPDNPEQMVKRTTFDFVVANEFLQT